MLYTEQKGEFSFICNFDSDLSKLCKIISTEGL